MCKEGLFSVVIPAYGREQYWKRAIDSVLFQDYPRIELVFCDDGTPGFCAEEVRQYIEKRKRQNLRRYEIVHHSQNLGTVSNLKRADELCTGRYLTHIAADDAYCSQTVLSQHAQALNRKEQGVLGIYANSIVCNRELVSQECISFDDARAREMNEMSSDEQFAVIAEGCCIHMGATAFIREEFMDSGGFDEGYQLIEDWPFFLKMMLEGYRFHYEPFDALYYRVGGITNNMYSSPGKRRCLEDHFRLYEELILKHFHSFSISKRMRIYCKYAADKEVLESIFGSLSKKKTELVFSDSRFVIYELLFRIRWHWKRLLFWILGMVVIGCLNWDRTIANVIWTMCVLAVGSVFTQLRKMHRHKKLIEGKI